MGRAPTLPQEFDRAQIGDGYTLPQVHDPTLFDHAAPESSLYVSTGMFAEDVRRARNGILLGAVATGGLVADHTLLHHTPMSLTILRECMNVFEVAILASSSVAVAKSALHMIRNRRYLPRIDGLLTHSLERSKSTERDSSWL